jgi:undecaprenyl-diphosphatase
MKESMQNQQNRQRWMLVSSLVIMAILFIILALADVFGLLRSTDLKITNFIELFKSPLLTKVADFLSWFGETPQGYLILVLSVIVLICARYRWEAVILGVSAFGAIVLDEIIKIIVRSPGPFAPTNPALMNFNDYTFPSGHVIFYMTFFGFVSYLLLSHMKSSWKRTIPLIFMGVLIVFVGIARVYLLAHWTSDVIGGYILGGMILIISVQVYKYGIKRNFKLCRRK